MHFVIHAIDRSDAGSLREHTRPTHLDYLGGFDVVFGGPMLDDDGAMCGSLIVVRPKTARPPRHLPLVIHTRWRDCLRR